MTLQLPATRDVLSWQTAVWNAPDDFLTRQQKLQFMQMLQARFNNFDPFVVVKSLLDNRRLWEGVIMDRAYVLGEEGDGRLWPSMGTDLIKLRDISRAWNVDTLFVLTDKEHQLRWQEIVGDWVADEVHFIEGGMAGRILGSTRRGATRMILRAWWD